MEVHVFYVAFAAYNAGPHRGPLWAEFRLIMNYCGRILGPFVHNRTRCNTLTFVRAAILAPSCLLECERTSAVLFLDALTDDYCHLFFVKFVYHWWHAFWGMGHGNFVWVGSSHDLHNLLVLTSHWKKITVHICPLGNSSYFAAIELHYWPFWVHIFKLILLCRNALEASCLNSESHTHVFVFFYFGFLVHDWVVLSRRYVRLPPLFDLLDWQS